MATKTDAKHTASNPSGRTPSKIETVIDFDSIADIADPDTLPRPVVALSLDVDAEKLERTAHSHRKGQLSYTTRGIATLETEDGLWIAPPNSAVWIPGGVRHSLKGTDRIAFRFLFVDESVVEGLPGECCILSVAPLLRELLLKFLEKPALYPTGDTREERLVAVLLDELAAAKREPLHLPMPKDARLRRLARMMMDDPSQRWTIDEWSARIGTSPRTLGRHFQEETGLTFGVWRRQLQLSVALRWLEKGESVTNVALDLGYENSSAFITMFKRALGQTPARYFASIEDVSG
jgi:AraC-like DNA-binding protein